MPDKNIMISSKLKNSSNLHERVVGPALAVDNVLFTIKDSKLNVLLIQIGSGPYENKWALPGGLVAEREGLDAAATRLLASKANISDLYLEQLYTFGDPNRDSRGNVVSVAYFSIVFDSSTVKLKTLPYYKGIEWFSVDNLPALAFDHKKIIEYAHKRLKSKLGYTNIAYNFLPVEFTLTELQKVYEIVLGKSLDKRNFRKKMDVLGILKDTNKVRSDVAHRPARLYKFKRRYLELID